MSFTIRQLHPLFAAELNGLDLRRVDERTLAEFKAAMARYAVCAAHHDEPLTNEEHIAFAARLGPIERRPILRYATDKKARIPQFEIIDQSNLDENGDIFPDDDKRMLYKRANRQWHTDVSFHKVRATYSALSCHLTPPATAGGTADTEFADMRAVYDALPAAMKARLEGLVAEHSYWYSRVRAGGPEPTEAERLTGPPAQHPLVHAHEPSGRKALYIASHASHIVGLPVEEGRALLAELMAFATEPRFVFRYAWRRGDVVVWDNLCTMHRATPFDDQTFKRDMRRTTCREGTLALEAAG
jgi:alpha-ketoglutarate-dependent 2,4-dichlorophenoxyacetate dioxygenase